MWVGSWRWARCTTAERVVLLWRATKATELLRARIHLIFFLNESFLFFWHSNFFILLLATDEILNATGEVGGISKIKNHWMLSESVLDLQNCSVAFMDAKNGFLTKFHIEIVIQKFSQLFIFSSKKKYFSKMNKNIFQNPFFFIFE